MTLPVVKRTSQHTPNSQEEEGMTQHENKARECKRPPNKSNISMRGRLNVPMQEGSDTERASNTMLPVMRRISQCTPNKQEEEETAQCE